MADNDKPTTVKVQTPVEGYDGTIAGVTFKDGTAETDDPTAVAYFRRHGYTLDGEAPTTPDPVEPPDVREPVRVGTPLEDAAATATAQGTDDEITELAAELADQHNRDDLDAQAEDAGLDPSDYRTKADIATAIVRARTGSA